MRESEGSTMAAEDPEKRFERAMDRLFASTRSSASCPATPAASSAGGSSPVRGTHAVSSAVAFRERRRSPAQQQHQNPSPSSRPLCRPWDRGDVLRRLATFKSMTWFGKPDVAGPVACARRGWINVGVDLLACEGCGAHLSFVNPPSAAAWSRTKTSDSPAEIFAEQLDSGHKALCAWKGNSCSETLALFPPTPPAGLVGGFHGRCEALLQLSALPVISGSAVDTFKLLRGPQIENVLAQPTPPMGSGFQYVGERRATGAESGEISENGCSYEGFYQAQRLIALCGWEPRSLPYTVDCVEGAPPPSKLSQLGDPCDAITSRKSRDPGPSVLLVTKGDKGEENVETGNKEANFEPASAVLDCSLCKASVGLWSFSTIPRPPISPSTAEVSEPPPSKTDAQICGPSAASVMDEEGKRTGRSTRSAEDDATATPVRPVRSSPPGVLNLNLTIAGGPPPTQLSSPAMIPPAFGPIPGFLQRFGQPEGSEVGDFVASHESRGSRDHDNGVQLGGSTVETMNERLVPADSTAEGTVVDRDVDDGGKGEGSLKWRRGTENSGAVDQLSQGAVLTSGNPNANTEMDTEVRHFHRKRRRTAEAAAGPSAHVPRHGLQDLLPCSSSVNAIDTHYLHKQENSMESVENRFQDSDGNETALSAENHVIDQVEGTEVAGQVVQSVDREAGSGRSVLQVEPGLSKSDEVGCDEDGVETNVAVISTGTGAAGGFSVGMGGGSAGTQASHEVEMQGEVNGADFSVHRPETTPGDTEFVPEVTEQNQGLMGEFVPDRGLMGESIPEENDQTAGPSDVRGDSDEVMRLHRSGKRRRLKGGIESESGKGRGKRVRNEGDDDDQTVDTTKAVIMYDDTAEQKKTTDGHNLAAVEVEEDQHGCTTVNGPRRGLEEFRIWDTETGEFDPIRQHRHFCPWVNGHVAIAEDSGSSQAGLCGWQLTVDALYTHYQQGGKTPHLAKSESTVSVHKAKSLVSGRILSGSSPSHTIGGRRTLF